MLLRFALLILLACALSEASAKGRLEERTAVVLEYGANERERRYLQYTPESAPAEGAALVLVIHGGGGTADALARQLGKTLHSLADRDGAYVIYPHAVNKMWDFGAGVVSEGLDERIDDRSYFQTLLDLAIQELKINDRRLFATGISRGGQASYFLACHFPERIRAIAPVAMPMPEFIFDSCPRGVPIGIAILNGTKDPLVPYDGGDIKVLRQRRGRVLSTYATVEYWRQRNGCNAAEPRARTENKARDRMRVRVFEWACTGAPVTLYRIEGGGHTWPSARQGLPRFLVGRVNKDIDASREIWSFFSQFD